METLKKYKTQIINFITIFLILEFAIYPGLTAASTFQNILAGVGLLLLIVWGGLALYQYVTSDKGGIVDKEELKQADELTKQKLESELGPVIDAMAKEILADKPKKRNPKQSAPNGTDETEPFVKTRKKSTKKTK
jgi:hypothetical protein